MNDVILQIVNAYLLEYITDKGYDPFTVWQSNLKDIIHNIPDDVLDEEYQLIRYVNNVIFWGQKELRNYV